MMGKAAGGGVRSWEVKRHGGGWLEVRQEQVAGGEASHVAWAEVAAVDGRQWKMMAHGMR